MSFDAEWFGDCSNTFHEEEKQLVYASRMGLLASQHGAHPPTFDLGGRSVVDIGGGPVSLLLKTVNRAEHCVVVDPGSYPSWVKARYRACGIRYLSIPAEHYGPKETFDDAWIYNCLQHVADPERVISVARTVARTIRLFEWIDIEPYDGHPHKLTEEGLNGWLGAPGFVSEVNESGAVGRAYYGVFSANPPLLAQ